VVEKDAYLKELCRYLVLNPVRAHMVKHPKEWKWSNYRATVGLEKAEDWLETNWILGQFGKRLRVAQKAYQVFVEDGIGKKESPWDNLYSRIYLGSEGFLDKVHEVDQKHKTLDVPKYQKHVVKQKPEGILAKVAKIYRVKVEDILAPGKKRPEARDVAIYLMKKDAGLSLKEIGKLMGVGPTAVGNRWVKMKELVLKDRELIDKIK